MNICTTCKKPKQPRSRKSNIIGGGIDDVLGGLVANYGLVSNSIGMITKSVGMVTPYSTFEMYQLPIVIDDKINYISIHSALKGCSIVTAGSDEVLRKILRRFKIDIENNRINRMSVLFLVFLCTIYIHLGITDFLHYLTEQQLQTAMIITTISDTKKYKPLWNKIKLSSTVHRKWVFDVINVLKSGDEGKIQEKVAEIFGIADQFMMDKTCDKGGYMECPQMYAIYNKLRGTLSNIKSDSKKVLGLLNGSRNKPTLEGVVKYGRSLITNYTPYVSFEEDNDNDNDNDKNKHAILYDNLIQMEDNLDNVGVVSDLETGAWSNTLESWFVDKSKAEDEEQRIIKLFLDITLNAVTPILGNVQEAQLQARDMSRSIATTTGYAVSFHLVILMIGIIAKLVEQKTKSKRTKKQ